MASSYDVFLSTHEPQLRMSGVPVSFWKSVYTKVEAETFDAGSYFQMIFDENEQNRWSVIASEEIDPANTECVFLVDHAWTFRSSSDARENLDTIPGLKERLQQLMDIDDVDDDGALVKEILHKMWMYAHTYSIAVPGMSTEERMPVWYVRDEFGSRIRHDDNPNCRTVPFYYAPQQCAYTLLFPLRSIDEDEEITIDYAEGDNKRKWRDYYLLPWFPKDVSDQPFCSEPVEAEFFTQNREMESLPDQQSSADFALTPDRPLKVFADSDQLVRHLKSEEFSLVADIKEADVLWLSTHFKDFKGLSDRTTLINQFPCESVLTVKDLLAAAVRIWCRQQETTTDKDQDIIDSVSLESTVDWFPVTFNLHTELPQFVAYYQRRRKRDIDNTWIVKPWNLARGLDMHVTDSLVQIIRLTDSGPKIACKYIDKPVLFRRPDTNANVKFDLRFIVLVKSVRPLVAYLYNNFWIRFAFTDFSLDRFDTFDKHFTVFNYDQKEKMLQMRCEDFIRRFSLQYPNQNWTDIEGRICRVLRESLLAASCSDPPKGIVSNPQSRAMYGVDVMLKWSDDEQDVLPVLLEYNFMPDCTRACDYYSDFADVIFSTLFLEKQQHHGVTLL